MTYDIVGAQGEIDDREKLLQDAQAWAARHGCEILVADARAVFGRDHLESAVRHAIRARDAKNMAAKTLPMEILRYLAARRQVSDAIRVAGIRPDTKRIALAFVGGGKVDSFLAAFGWSRDDDVLRAEGKSLANLGISGVQAKTVPQDRRADLALERVALLEVMT